MKYRLPILHRVPFIKRRVIVRRAPIILRKAITHRVPIGRERTNYLGCVLRDECVGCDGTFYAQYDDASANFGVFRIIRITVDSDTQDIVNKIEKVEQMQKYVRVITEIPVGEDILFALAYSPYNVIQFTLDCMQPYDREEWRRSIYMASSCGLWASLMVYPILPTVIKSSYIVELISEYHGIINHYCLKWFQTNSRLEPNIDGYLVNGYLIPEDYLSVTDKGTECSQKFVDTFVTSLNMFLKPSGISRGIRVSVCNNHQCY